tara:strand:- start:604 stop:750 length:147 start_codon:yes stop_codon:yes gene_type:complete
MKLKEHLIILASSLIVGSIFGLGFSHGLKLDENFEQKKIESFKKGLTN